MRRLDTNNYYVGTVESGYGVFNITNNSLDGVYDTSEDAREEIEYLLDNTESDEEPDEYEVVLIGDRNISTKSYNSNAIVYIDDGEDIQTIHVGFDGWDDFTCEENSKGLLEVISHHVEDLTDSEKSKILELFTVDLDVHSGTKKSAELYIVRSASSGASSPTELYFDSKEKAYEYLAKCDNGEVVAANINYVGNLNYSDGCTFDELIYTLGTYPEIDRR